MDVDLLRPGTVPISPDTVLWFEFLLDKELLLKHLQKPLADPSPIELIIRFSSAIIETLRNRPEAETADIMVTEYNMDSETKHPLKNIALKCLSLKVAAYLKWDIEQLRSLPFKTQTNLLQDLLYFTNERTYVEIPNIPEESLSSLSQANLFAHLIYHRWLLNSAMHRINTNLQHRLNSCDIYPSDENIICSPENVEKAIAFITEALKWEEIPHMLTYDCLKIPSEEDDQSDIDWAFSESISKAEFHAQLNYDLGTYFFFKENYELAKQHFTECINCFNDIKENNGFVKFDKDMLQIYLKACNGDEYQKGDLLDQLNASIFNHYVGLTSILQQDNINREIPLTHRMNLELDIQGALSSGTFTVARDFLYKVRALNIIRFVLDKKHVFNHSTVSLKNINTLIWAIQGTWSLFPEADKECLKSFLIELILKDDVPNLLALIQSNETLCNTFTAADISYIENSKINKLNIPDSLNKTDWTIYDTNKKRKPKMELRQLEQQLISTYDYKQIREVLVKIALTNSGISVWKLNPKWELPIPLQSVLKSLPRGYIQDFGFVLLAKAKEQMLNKNWNSSLELLIVIDKEVQEQSGNFSKLTRLVSWEILLVQIAQLFDDWPKNSVDKHALANACEACLQNNDSILPRTEIIEHCVICLLNLGRWDFLVNLEKRWSFMEISSGIALACQELVKHKGNKKLPKNLWDSVLPIFSNSQAKRSTAGCMYQDSQLTSLKVSVMNIFSKLRDSIALTVVISMLTRLHNVLKDEPSLELQLETVLLWPAVVSNANSYNIKTVIETLSQVVTQALSYYPTNVPWLRLLGDINFTNGHYKIALNYYLKSLLIYNDYFNIPVRSDDHVFRRMIKSCSQLGCHTQAAVLCQFLEEPDYVLAFRILGDQKYCNDAVDAYYHCFWDINILEFLIHNHHKKGEFQRRKCAVQVMGLLELNSSNNEEIQREASNLRKSTFLRALCKQYVFT